MCSPGHVRERWLGRMSENVGETLRSLKLQRWPYRGTAELCELPLGRAWLPSSSLPGSSVGGRLWKATARCIVLGLLKALFCWPEISRPLTRVLSDASKYLLAKLGWNLCTIQIFPKLVSVLRSVDSLGMNLVWGPVLLKLGNGGQVLPSQGWASSGYLKD